MTNIVGGNTSNLAQLGSSQDGSNSNPLGADGNLDFLSLISFVDDLLQVLMRLANYLKQIHQQKSG